MEPERKKSIGILSLIMINFAAIANVRSLPSLAPYGTSMLFYYLLATCCFLIPCALVSAELASGFPGQGGLYHWVSKAMGKRLGFLVVWLQNSNNFMCFSVSLSFVAGAIAYGFCPSMADNRWFTLAVVWAIIWGGTIFTLNGMKLTSWVSGMGGLLGTFLPIALIVGLCIYWLVSGRPSQIDLSWRSFWPDISGGSSLSLLLGALLGFSGLEMSANHIMDVDRPEKKFPIAIFLSALLILVVSVLGSLAIAIVVPKSEIAMNAGAMQAFMCIFSEFGMEFMLPVLAVMMVLGMVAWFFVWVSGPPRALHVAACQGDLPAFFCRLNRHGMPGRIMFVQAVIASGIALLLFSSAESISIAFWILTVVTGQFLLLMYVMMFLSGIILKYKFPEAKRFYKIPGGKLGMWVVAGIGVLMCGGFYIIGFFPPEDLMIQSKWTYVIAIVLGNLLIGLLPYILLGKKKRC